MENLQVITYYHNYKGGVNNLQVSYVLDAGGAVVRRFTSKINKAIERANSFVWHCKFNHSQTKAMDYIERVTGYSNVQGTDMGLQTCINEGYLMMQTADKPINPDKQYNFFAFVPDYIIDEMQVSTARKMDDSERLILDISFSLNNLLERYNIYKAAIDQTCGCDYPLKPKKYKNYYQILYLADAINSYCGLN